MITMTSQGIIGLLTASTITRYLFLKIEIKIYLYLNRYFNPCFRNLKLKSKRNVRLFSQSQGPEWVWCMGFFLRAQLATLTKEVSTAAITSKLTPQFHSRILSLIIRWRSSTDISPDISPICSSTALSGDHLR